MSPQRWQSSALRYSLARYHRARRMRKSRSAAHKSCQIRRSRLPQPISIGYELIGPSPEVSDLADLASRSRQLAGALFHLGTGDMVQVTYNRQPAPEPPAREFAHRAAALVDAERRAQFAAQNHWLTPTRLWLSHQFDPPVRSQLKAMLFAANGPASLA